MLITAQLPAGGAAVFGVADGTLVFDGSEFVKPQSLTYAELYGVPVNAQSMPYKELPAQVLSAAVKIRARVLNVDPTEAPTDPTLVTVADPLGGECICGLTCNGTELRFVVVQLEN